MLGQRCDLLEFRREILRGKSHINGSGVSFSLSVKLLRFFSVSKDKFSRLLNKFHLESDIRSAQVKVT